MNNNAVWFVTTEHLEDRLLFRDRDDFRVAMNYVAMLVHKVGVSVLAFSLMSNHVHFVMACAKELAEKFITDFKAVYSKYLTKKYGFREHLRDLGVDMRAIDISNEGLEKVVAYVQMNPVAANICTFPSDYLWGSGRVFFDPNPLTGTPLNKLSAREQFRILRTKVILPSDWVLTEHGFIDPRCYIKKEFVESVFRTPKRMSFFLRNSSKAKLRLESQENGIPAFKDQLIVAAIPDLCWSMFQKKTIGELNEEQSVELFRQIRYRFSANVNQIARVTGFSYEYVAACLDRP